MYYCTWPESLYSFNSSGSLLTKSAPPSPWVLPRLLIRVSFVQFLETVKRAEPVAAKTALCVFAGRTANHLPDFPDVATTASSASAVLSGTALEEVDPKELQYQQDIFSHYSAASADAEKGLLQPVDPNIEIDSLVSGKEDPNTVNARTSVDMTETREGLEELCEVRSALIARDHEKGVPVGETWREKTAGMLESYTRKRTWSDESGAAVTDSWNGWDDATKSKAIESLGTKLAVMSTGRNDLKTELAQLMHLTLRTAHVAELKQTSTDE